MLPDQKDAVQIIERFLLDGINEPDDWMPSLPGRRVTSRLHIAENTHHATKILLIREILV